MKIYILSLFTLIILSACETKNVDVQSTNIIYCGNDFKIVTMDSCEWISYGLSYGYRAYSHRGRCKFCKARRLAEMAEFKKSIAIDTLDDMDILQPVIRYAHIHKKHKH